MNNKYVDEAMRGVLITILMLTVFGCNNPKEPVIEGDITPRTATIATLRQQIGTVSGRTIDHNVIVQGRVTSSDKDGNFYRSLVIEDESGAMEIMVGLYDLYTLYPEGTLLSLNLKGCATDYDYGILRAGAKAHAYDSYDVTYISSREDIDRVIERSRDVAPIEPRHTTISELSNRACGELIRIEGLELRHTTSIDTLQGMTLADATWRGYALFFDTMGDSIAVYTSENSRFAKSSIPTTPISITGILQHGPYNGGKECLQLKMRYATDYEEL